MSSKSWGTSVGSTGLSTSTTGWTTASSPVPTGYTNAAGSVVAGGDKMVGWVLAAAGGMAALVSIKCPWTFTNRLLRVYTDWAVFGHRFLFGFVFG